MQTLPTFSDPMGLRLRPPYSFQGMVVHVFPLRADPQALQTFADSYVNETVPGSVARLRTCAPYVFLMMIDYGKLAIRSQNLGWFSQNEIMFAIPYARYRIEGERWFFADWAWLGPFIFVDSSISLTLGRTVMGWPKVFCRMAPSMSQWMRDPRLPVRNATVTTSVYPELFAGAKAVERAFLTVDGDASLPAQFPLDLQSPFMFWNLPANTASAMNTLARGGRLAFESLGLLPNKAWGGPENVQRMLGQMARMANPRSPDLYFDNLNLKQFRDAEHPTAYCYQSLTSAKMAFTDYNGGGLLGAQRVMAGDLSGGYAVQISKWPSLPLVDQLGIEVDRSWRGDGVDIAEVRPVMPFWYDVDMIYERPVNLAWRGPDRLWRDGSGVAHALDGTPSDATGYNTTLWAQTVTGPFQFRGTTARVLPLLAERDTLQRYLDQWLNQPLDEDAAEPPRVRFSVWGPEDPTRPAFVYLLATSLGTVTSSSANVGDWANQEVSLVAPVRLEERVEGRWEHRRCGIVPLITWSNDQAAVISTTEVLGIPILKGTIESPPDPWMSSAPCDRAERGLLTVTAEVLPALDLGQEALTRTVLEAVAGDMPPELSHSRWLAEHWGPLVRDEVARKWRMLEGHFAEGCGAMALACELLNERQTLNVFTMKQFRDANHPEGACYQAIVRVPRRIHSVLDMREIEEPLHLRIHEYASHPIVSRLGLIGRHAPDQDGGVVYVVQPLRPFWVRLDWEEGTGENLWHRAGGQAWRATLGASAVLRPSPEPVERRSPRDLFDQLNLGDPRRLLTRLREWEALPPGSALPSPSAQEVAAIDPQVVIELMLSRECENQSPEARWVRARASLEKALRECREGRRWSDRRSAEREFFNARVEELAKLPHRSFAVNLILPRREIFEAFALTREQSERCAPLEDDSKDVPRALGKLGNSLEELCATLCRVLRLSPEGALGDAHAADRLLREPGLRAFAKAVRDIPPLRPFSEAVFLRLDEEGCHTEAWEDETVVPERFAGGARGAYSGWRGTGDAGRTTGVLTIEQAVWVENAMRVEYRRQREALITELARASGITKPAFCVRRGMLGEEADRLFPDEPPSADREWLAGRSLP